MKKLHAVVSLVAGLSMVFVGCSKKGDEAAGTNSSEATAPAVSATNPIVAAPVPVGPPVELKIKWAVGKKYLLNLQKNQDSNMKVDGQPVEQIMSMGTDYSLAVTNALPGGGYDLEMEFLAQKIDMRLDRHQTIGFDSATDPANDEKNPYGPTLRKIIGSHVGIEMDANGKVQNITGIDELVKVPADNTAPMNVIKSMYDKDTLKLYAELSEGLPDHPVKMGETWPVMLDVPMGQMGTISLNLTYIFQGWDQHDDRKCAQLNYAGTITARSDTSTNTVPFQIDNGKINGTTWFDVEAGMIVENTSEETMDVKISPTPDQTIKAAMVQKTDLKLVDVNDIK